MHYLQGDAPAAPILVQPARDGDPVDLDDYTAVTAQLLQPEGDPVDAVAGLVDEEGQRVVQVTLPQLDQVGVLQLVVRLSDGDRHDRFTAEPIIVEALDGWHTLDTAREEAPGFRNLEDVRLYVLLAGAREDCTRYKPKAATRRPTLQEREAQLMQARNRNAAARVDPASGDGGVDGYSVGAFPLDWVVKATLRPQRRFGAIR